MSSKMTVLIGEFLRYCVVGGIAFFADFGALVAAEDNLAHCSIVAPIHRDGVRIRSWSHGQLSAFALVCVCSEEG